jgi:hypothetical protein
MSLERADQHNVYSLVENNIIPQSLNITTSTNLSQFTVAEQTISAWVYWLGSDLVSQWRTLPIEEWSLATIFEQLNPQFYCANSLLLTALGQSKTSSGELVAELNIGYQEIYQQPKYLTSSGTLKWLIPLTATLATSLTKSLQKCLEQLEVNLDESRTQAHQKLQIYFYLLRSAGTKTAFARLDDLSAQLQSLIKEYEWQWQENLYKSNASRHSFENLSAQISQWWELSKQQKADSALNSLRLTYKYQLSGQLYNAACQLLKELESQTQQHILMLANVDLCLADLQSWFTQQYPLEPVPADFLKHYLSPRINPRQLLSEIEQWAGIPKQEWMNLDQNKSDQLKTEILDKLQPVCWQFYTECFQVSKKLTSSDA